MSPSTHAPTQRQRAGSVDSREGPRFTRDRLTVDECLQLIHTMDEAELAEVLADPTFREAIRRYRPFVSIPELDKREAHHE